jgi:hypothetical protein
MRTLTADSAQLAHHDELLAAAAHYLAVQSQLVKGFRDPDCARNTAILRLFQVEALLSLGRHDEAAGTLGGHPELFTDPANAHEARRLDARVQAARTAIAPEPRRRARPDVA